MTSDGIEPATYRFVAQHLNPCATAVPIHNFKDTYVHLGAISCKYCGWWPPTFAFIVLKKNLFSENVHGDGQTTYLWCIVLMSMPKSCFLLTLIISNVCICYLGMWHVWMRREGFIGSWWGNRRERDHWGDLGIDGWIILECISRRWDVGMWTGLGWPRIGTGGGRLWVR